MFYFPSDLPQTIVRSFALRFYLEALLEKEEEKLCFYSKLLVQASQDPMRNEIDLLTLLEGAEGDENLWVYLIENRNRLNVHFGHQVVDALFQMWFPRGAEQFRTALSEKLRLRGFLSLYTTLEPEIEAMQWPHPR